MSIIDDIAKGVRDADKKGKLQRRKRRQNKHGGASHVTLNNPNAGGAAARGKPTKGYQMAVKDHKDLKENQA